MKVIAIFSTCLRARVNGVFPVALSFPIGLMLIWLVKHGRPSAMVGWD
jgi:hypothetical protein